MSYSFLKPVRIGNMVLKNRVIVPAMARYLCKDGYVTDAYVEYLRAIAEGGVAMVTVGIMPIDLNWPSTMPTQPSARLRQPMIRKISCLSFNFYLLGISSCGRFRPNRPCRRCASSMRGATRARPSCPRAPRAGHAG